MSGKRKELVVGLSSPVSAVALCSYFDTFGDIECMDLSGMYEADSSNTAAARIRYFDNRAPILAMNHLKGVSILAPKVVEVDPLGTSTPESISLCDVSLSASSGKPSGEVNISNLRWKVGETIGCCEKFGDIELINGEPIAGLPFKPNSESMAVTVTFYDKRAADNFLRVLKSVKGKRRASENLGEDHRSWDNRDAGESLNRRTTVPVTNVSIGKQQNPIAAQLASLASTQHGTSFASYSTTIQGGSATRHSTERSATAAAAAATSSTSSPPNPVYIEFSGEPREGFQFGPANLAETVAMIVGNSQKSGKQLELSVAERKGMLCETIKEWGKPFIPESMRSVPVVAAAAAPRQSTQQSTTEKKVDGDNDTEKDAMSDVPKTNTSKAHQDGELDRAAFSE